MKGQGLIKRLPTDLREQLENVNQFAKIMEKKNGHRPKEKVE